ncbi:MAG: O-antigen ligase family protein [Planctomycetota bacterium]|nr:O-antigen ligase family protein [Planctomycetota bacterium]
MSEASSPGVSRGESVLVPLGAAALLGLIAFRCLVMISPDPSFDLDPMAEASPWFGLGPSGSSMTSIWILLASSVVLFGERFSGRGVDRGLLLLWMLPIIAVVLHGLGNGTSFWISVDWFAAAAGGVTLAHACRAPGVRALVLGGILGLCSILAVRGGVQLLFEHRETVEFFRANRESLLGAFGWAPGSVQADLYERRLLQPEATGWFGLSNLFSGLMAVAFVLGFLSLLVVGARVSSGARALLYACWFGGFLTLIIVNGSKGAIGAMALGILVASIPLFVPAWRSRGVHLAGVMAVAALFLTFFIVIARGLFGVSAFAGELSLLVRWQYLVGAVQILAEHPWFGIGPGGFQSAFLAVRPALSPEEPSSPHNALLDWLVAYGIFGTSWVCLLLLMAFRTGASTFRAGAASPRQWLFFVFALCAATYGSFLLEAPTLTPVLVVFRLVGLALGLVILMTAGSVLQSMRDSRVPWVMGATVATLGSLAVLDMLFSHPGSVALVWALLGSVSVARSRPVEATGPIPAGTPAVCGVALFFAAVQPQQEVDRRLEEAARPLRAVAAFTNEIDRMPRSLTPITRMEALDAVLSRAGGLIDEGTLGFEEISSLAPGSNDPSLIARALLRGIRPDLRRTAIEQLVTCWDLHPNHSTPAWASIDQLRLLSAEPGLADADRFPVLLEALTRTQRMGAPRRIDEEADASWFRSFPAFIDRLQDPVRSAVTAAWIEQEAAQLAPEQASWEAVADAFRVALRHHPGDPKLHAALVDALRRLDDREAERAALEQALLVNRQKRLDPLVQYSDARRLAYEQRLEQLRQSSK